MNNREPHPLDEQNRLEREIQLEGARDPDNYRMPDNRTLTEVRNDLDKEHREEFVRETEMIGETTRKASLSEFSKGGKLVMTKTGNIIDVTVPKVTDDPVNEPEIEEEVELHLR